MASFEERIKLKQRRGFDHQVSFKSEILARKATKENYDKEKLKKKNETYNKGQLKKMPKERFSKLPVSVIRPLNLNQEDEP